MSDDHRNGKLEARSVSVPPGIARGIAREKPSIDLFAFHIPLANISLSTQVAGSDFYFPTF